MDLHFYNFKRRHFNGESSPTQNFKENEFTLIIKDIIYIKYYFFIINEIDINNCNFIITLKNIFFI